ncbi:RNA polymerase sporulation sigma factor SigE, partial [Rhizobium sp. KAs_5_22]
MRLKTKVKIEMLLLWKKFLDFLGLSEGVFYIGGSEALPPPLSMEEETYLVSKMEKGDNEAKTVL